METLGGPRGSCSWRLSSWESGNCYLTLVLGARLGELGCLGGGWEGERGRQAGTLLSVGLQFCGLGGGSAVQDLSGKGGQMGWAVGENPRPSRRAGRSLFAQCCQVHMVGLVDLHSFWGGEE